MWPAQAISFPADYASAAGACVAGIFFMSYGTSADPHCEVHPLSPDGDSRFGCDPFDCTHAEVQGRCCLVLKKRKEGNVFDPVYQRICDAGYFRLGAGVIHWGAVGQSHLPTR